MSFEKSLEEFDHILLSSLKTSQFNYPNEAFNRFRYDSFVHAVRIGNMPLPYMPGKVNNEVAAHVFEQFGRKLLDASPEIAVRLCGDLVTKATEIVEQGESLTTVGVRIVIHANGLAEPLLCNHNAGCDCGMHPPT